ncbi:MAG: carbohydrate ABC transporter permease [Candidatus Oleimicrobiaceae bacterium]
MRLRIDRATRRNLRNGILFISPWVVGFAVFTAYPLGASFYYSLTNFTILRSPQWVGLANYTHLLLKDDLFRIALYNTLYYVALSVPIGTIFCLAAAMLLNVRIRGISLFRTVFYLPTMVPAVATAIIWIMLLNPQFGIVNSLIRFVGGRPPGWIADPDWAKPALILMHTWGMGGTIIIYLAALQDVPVHLVEAALLDGANAWKRFRHVTIPMISPAILFNVVVNLISAFQYFTAAYIMTDGGPNNATLFYALYLYRTAFVYVKMGYASALAWLLLILTLAFTLFILRTGRRRVYYGAEG